MEAYAIVIHQPIEISRSFKTKEKMKYKELARRNSAIHKIHSLLK